MIRSKFLVTAFLPIFCLACAGVTSKQRAVRQPLVQNIAGIRIGPDASHDEDVTKVFGSGLYTDQEGHGGGRYFTDPSRNITLHIEMGVDYVIDKIELTQWIVVPAEFDLSNPAFVSQALVTVPKMEKDLRLGMSCDQVTSKLGAPKTDVKAGNERTISYQTSYEEDERVSLDYEATFVFVNDRVVKISIYDGE